MTSEIRANTIKNRVGLGTIEYTNTGPVISGVTTALNFKTGTSNLHNTGLNIFDLDVDGHTNLDNVSVAGVTTMTGNLTVSNTAPAIFFTDTDNDNDFRLIVEGGIFRIQDVTAGNTSRFRIHSNGLAVFSHNVSIDGDLDVDGHTNLDNVSIAGVSTFAGDITLGDSIIHQGDTDTKIRFPSNNNISFETNGNERLRIKNDGTVYTVAENRRFGIGQDPDATTMGATSGTWQVPEVDGQTIGSELRIGDINTGSTAVIRLASYGAGDQGVGGGAIMFTNTRNGSASYHSDIAAIKGARESLGKGYLRFFTANQAANQERLRITSDGRVGVSEETPDTQLHVSGNANAQTTAGAATNTAIRITDTDTAAQSGQIYGEIQFETRDATSPGVAAYITAQGNSSGSAALNFGTGSGGSASTKMTIHQTGNASLGYQYTVPNEYSNQTTFTINGNTYGRLDLEVAGALKGSLWANSGGLGLDAGANDIEMFTGSQQRIKINTSGQVGIGQGFSPSRQLDVKDSTGANRIMNIRGTGTSGAFLAFLDANTTDETKCRIGSKGGNDISIRGDAHYFQNGGGTNRMVIASGGNVEISDGNLVLASGHGIDFSATSDASGQTGELLDEYEEGTWTPTAHGFTISSTYSAKYTLIGRICHISCYVQAATGTGTSVQPQIGGLPFTSVGGNTYSYGAGRIGTGGYNNSQVDIAFQQQSSSDDVKFYVGGGGINESMMSGGHVIFSLVYQVA